MQQRLEFAPLHLYWAVFVAPLCPVDKKSIPYWQTPDTNGTSSRFMELLVLIQFCLVIPCWTHSCVFGFFTFFPTPKNCLVEDALHVSASMSVFSHVEGFFMLTLSVDIYMYRESLATLPNPSFLKLWDIPVFTCFYFKTGNEKTKPYFSYFCESLLQISGRLVEKEQLCPAERKWSQIVSIMKWFLKCFFSRI